MFGSLGSSSFIRFACARTSSHCYWLYTSVSFFPLSVVVVVVVFLLLFIEICFGVIATDDDDDDNDDDACGSVCVYV